MKNFDYIDEQTLGAFVDGQLDAAQRSSVIQAMDKDPEVREQVYQLRRSKDLMKLGFDSARPTGPATAKGKTPVRRYAIGAAASFAMLAVGFSAGTLGYYCMRYLDSQTSTPALAAQQQANRVVLHIGDADPRHFSAALNYVDRFLKENAASGGQIEVVANAGGLDLMRADLSPYEQRVLALINRHNNVHFIACANAIRNLELQGIEPRILKDVDTEQSALDHIVDRLQSGWTYIEVESLPEA
jgi:intracellular sulfur oxidation DsrE/DsrF family protein